MNISEGDIKFEVTKMIAAKKFDDEKHGLSHCMKAIDIILEKNDRIIFLEIKDPQNPKAAPQEMQEWKTALKNDQNNEFLFDKFILKCRDSFIYQWSKDLVNKPIDYYILICIDSLTETDLQAISQRIRHLLPARSTASRIWERPFIDDCLVFNLMTWNEYLKNCPAIRISNKKSNNK